MNFATLNKKIRVLIGTFEIFQDQYRPRETKGRRLQIRVLRDLLDDMEASIQSIRTEIDRMSKRG